MFKYFVRRFLLLLPKLLVITIIIFIGIQLIPGDPLTHMLPPEAYENLDLERLEELRDHMGLNDSLPEQYFRWFFGVMKGDFGYSLISGANIRDMLISRLPATFEIAFMGLLIATFFGLIFGVLSAINQNGPIDYLNTVLGIIGVSVPEFIFGLSMILIFSLRLKWFPSGGRFAAGKTDFFSRLKYLVLPSTCLGIGLIAALMRYTRSSMLDILGKDYIKTAKSKGISNTKVYIKHGFRNALIPVAIVLTNRIRLLVGGTVVIESIFNFPGMGKLLLDSISGADMPVIMMATLIIAVIILFSSLLMDIITALIDPRVKFEG
jgi:peptide/nickel transport system permease protein